MKRSEVHIRAFIVVVFLLADLPLVAYAQTDVRTYVPLTPIGFTIPTDTGNTCEARFDQVTQLSKDTGSKAYQDAYSAYKAHCVTSLPKYLRGLYIGGVVLAGFLAVFSIVRGGFTLLFTDSILGHSEAKGIILRALGGLIVVYASYALMNTINPQLGTNLNLSLDFPRVQVSRGLMKQLFSSDMGLGYDQNSVMAAMERYGMQLEQIRQQVDATQKKAIDLKTEREALEDRMENGDYTSEEGPQIVKKIGALRAQEVQARNFEQGTDRIVQDRVRMISCLNGQGDCQRLSEANSIGGRIIEKIRGATAVGEARSATQMAVDDAVARGYIDSEEAYVAEQKGKLEEAAKVAEAAGLTQNAAALRADKATLDTQLTNTKKMYDFWKACPNAGVLDPAWQSGQVCPPARTR